MKASVRDREKQGNHERAITIEPDSEEYQQDEVQIGQKRKVSSESEPISTTKKRELGESLLCRLPDDFELQVEIVTIPIKPLGIRPSSSTQMQRRPLSMTDTQGPFFNSEAGAFLTHRSQYIPADSG